jgi:hypothetical protein
MQKRKLILVLIVVLGFTFFYQLYYKRYFISNKDGSEVFTIWPRLGNDCLIIPGKYYSPFNPKDNFIKTVTHTNFIGVVWETGDSIKYKLSIYNSYEAFGIEKEIRIYSDNEQLLAEYDILNGSDSIEFHRRRINYEYIDLNRVWGIKKFSW